MSGHLGDDTEPAGTSAAERAFEQLKLWVLTGHLGAGHRLVERQLADALGVSRTPLREALRRLEQDRLVERTPGNSALRVTTLDERSVSDLYNLRGQIEVLAVRLAIDRAPDAEIKELVHDVNSGRRAAEADDVEAVTELTAQFHDRLYAMTRSQWLLATVEPLRSQLMRIRVRMARLRIPDSYEQEHREIAEALLARDNAAAEEAVLRHVATDLRTTLRHLDAVLAADPPA